VCERERARERETERRESALARVEREIESCVCALYVVCVCVCVCVCACVRACTGGSDERGASVAESFIKEGKVDEVECDGVRDGVLLVGALVTISLRGAE